MLGSERLLFLASIQECASVYRAMSSLAGLSVGISLASFSAFISERIQRLHRLRERQKQRQIWQLQQLQQPDVSRVPSFEADLIQRLIRKNSRYGVMEEYTFQKAAPLGEGSFGVVVRATHNRTGIERAIKRIDKRLTPDPLLLTREVESLKVMDHPCVCRLVEYFETSQHLWLVTELCRGEELCEKLLTKPTGLPQPEVARLMEQMLRATCHCHARSVLHRDLKPENFMTLGRCPDPGNDNLKLIDFGFAVEDNKGKHSPSQANFPAGTLMYMSPQALQGEAASQSDDVWSLGVTLYILLTGHFPFSTNNDARFQEMSRHGLLKKDMQHHLAALPRSPAADLACKLLAWDPASRITVEDALQHPFLAEASRACGQSAALLLDAKDVYLRTVRFCQSCQLRRIVLATVVQSIGDCWKDGERAGSTYLDLEKRGHGKVSSKEIRDFLQANGISPSTADFSAMEQSLCPKGIVSYTTFLAATLDDSTIARDKQLCRAVFDILDADHDGVISAGDLQKRFGLGFHASSYAVDEALATIREKSFQTANVMDFESFLLLLREPPSSPSSRLIAEATSSRPEGGCILSSGQLLR